ncbi:Ger(x)C family spore germination protein [Alkalihalobacillus sp. BA299]|uniref:Ger(x)C family spore germination protein n=1 Tax=Alkalihalobacillus sp. BA299 TaxID=2815938 RepID=UPI001AD98CA0|nr:Ger(x)C family spore germination protein [Alkalihalobacillus sp. BA299]
MQSRNNVQSLFISLLVIFLLFLTGCWDQRDIEELSINVGEALDMGEPSPHEQEFEKEGGGYQKRNLFTFTMQNVVPQASGGGQQEGGGQQKAYENLSVTGDSVYQLFLELTLIDEHIPLGSHLKVVVIGEELARNINLLNLMNEYIRSHELRESVIYFIAKGKARDALEAKRTEIPAFHLVKISENEKMTTRILPPVTQAKLNAYLSGDSSFLLQTVSAIEGEVKFAGGAVINGKTKKLHGFLNAEELDGITWITGKGEGGAVKSFDEETNQLIVYQAESIESKITSYLDGENISFDVKIESKGRLVEDWVWPGNAFESEFLKKTEKAAEKEVERLVSNVLKKMQEEYQVDVAGFGNRLRIEHPKVWEKIKKDWDKTFSDVHINYSVEITITDYSTTGTKE